MLRISIISRLKLREGRATLRVGNEEAEGGAGLGVRLGKGMHVQCFLMTVHCSNSSSCE